MFSTKNGFSHKSGSAWEIFTPAKLNLYLEVVGPRAAGFHPLETLMVPVRIFDQLRWNEHLPETSAPETSTPRLQICNLLANQFSTETQLGNLADNLVLKAVDKLARVAGVEPRGSFQLVKRIPIQAGLGGGSSDAAAALLLANEAWGINYSRQRLSELAADLGSDVPFCLGSGPAICRGRGEQVEPVTGLPRLHFVVVKPPVGLSTPKVFEQLSAKIQMATTQTATERRTASSVQLAALVEALRRGALADAGQRMMNRLESAAGQLSPWIDRLRKVFSQLGCWAHLMTGSGTAYVGVMRSARQARIVARSITGMMFAAKANTGIEVGSVFATSSC